MVTNVLSRPGLGRVGTGCFPLPTSVRSQHVLQVSAFHWGPSRPVCAGTPGLMFSLLRPVTWTEPCLQWTCPHPPVQAQASSTGHRHPEMEPTRQAGHPADHLGSLPAFLAAPAIATQGAKGGQGSADHGAHIYTCSPGSTCVWTESHLVERKSTGKLRCDRSSAFH